MTTLLLKHTLLLLLLILTSIECRKSGSGRGSSRGTSTRGVPSSRKASRGGSRKGSVAPVVDDFDRHSSEILSDDNYDNEDGDLDDYDVMGAREEEYDDDEEEEDFDDMMYDPMPSARPVQGRQKRGPPPHPSSRRQPPSRGNGRRGPPPSKASSRGRPRGGRYPPNSRRPGGMNRGGRRGNSRSNQAVVPYVASGASAITSTFTRGMESIKSHIPDPNTVKASTINTFNTLQSATGKYVREVKGMLSSELEQVLLKSTRPDDIPVKAKHMERLIGVTYQISGQYDLYDPILRKLWGKMSESDWRSSCKALYVLHRFSADGASEHGMQLKARLRELRRTKDPKQKGNGRYFNTKQLMATKSSGSEEQKYFRAYLQRYAHYVLLRAQCFSGMFTEIAPRNVEQTSGSSRSSSRSSSSRRSKSKSSKNSEAAAKPITATALRSEHLDAARMLLKAGCACVLKDGEDCEVTASCAERVALDMNGLTTAVATALNRALQPDSKSTEEVDAALIKSWCEFYSQELLPQTKAMLKKTSDTLDAYGMFLPSRMGASVAQELLEKGLLKGEAETSEDEENKENASPAADEADDEVEADAASVDSSSTPSKAESADDEQEENEKEAVKADEQEDEYEYDEYEYDDED